MKLAIYDDFSKYTSKPLKDFLYESNRGKDVFFAASEEKAITKLSEQSLPILATPAEASVFLR